MSRPAPGAEFEIRESTRSDERGIETLYPRAFPDEDLLPLVRQLLRERLGTISLVATAGSDLAGNILFTKCATGAGARDAALLGPLAVAPEYQRRGTGSALVRAGLQRLADAGVNVVYVLGDPAYYRRLGFSPERSVWPPHSLPPEWADAWQSQRLGDAIAATGGTLVLPDCWLDPELWSA